MAPEVRRLFDYWLAKRNGRLVPARGDIDPVDIPWALERLFLIAYDRARDSFTYRLAGEAIAGFYGRGNIAGVGPEAFLEPDVAAMVHRRWSRVVAGTPSVLFGRGTVYKPVRDEWIGQRILLPLAEDGRSADHILGFTRISERRPRPDGGVQLGYAFAVVPADGLPV